MKHYIFSSLLFLFPLIVVSQESDSIATLQLVDSLIQLSQNFIQKNDLAQSLEKIADAEKIASDRFGRESVAYGRCCMGAGLAFYYKGEFQESEKWYLLSKAILEKKMGKENPDYARIQSNLALNYFSMGQYDKAENLYLEVKSVREKLFGKEHPDYANTLNALAIFYKNLGDYEKAELLYLEAREIFEKTFGKEHSRYADVLHNLGALYFTMGNYEKAEPLYLESRAIRDKTAGKESPEYASALNNLGLLYFYMRLYEKSEPLYLESIDIRGKILGKQHPAYASSVSNLAYVYQTTGRYEQAESLFLETLAIREKALGKSHPDYAAGMSNLASLYREMGRFDNLEPLYLQSKVIFENTLGREHPAYTSNLSELAALYKDAGLYEKAEPLIVELSEIDKRLLQKSLRHLSTQELNNYLSLFSTRQDRMLSFAQMTGSPQIIPVCYDNTLFYKGFLLNAANRLRQPAFSDTATLEKYKLLQSFERRLAKEYGKPMAVRDSAAIAGLEQEVNTIEKEIARAIAGFDEALRQVSRHEVQSNLKPGEVAVEFVHYRYYEKNQTDSILYAALLLSPGQKYPAFIPITEEKQLDSLLHVSGERRAYFVNNLYTLADRGVSPLEKPRKTLYELLWKPLEPYLTDVKKIYFAPSGLLHRINLAAIPLGLDSVLADRYQFVEFGSTRQLVIPTVVKNTLNDAALFGGIQYDTDDAAVISALSDSDSMLIASRREWSFADTDSSLRNSSWTTLPFTEREIINAEKILQSAGFTTKTRRGYAATEEYFKSIGAADKTSPRVLHIATHGYFFPDPETSARLQTSPTLGAAEPVFKRSEHPMIRSGLLLAGANHAWTTGKPVRPELEDGILTAYEISQMNLSNTELVVLSACETGLGDIQGNEGVYGLQRAFKIAGAKYLIMSLWQVPDKQTSLLMTAFYRKWLEDQMQIPEAFHAAQKELREAGLDPYYWAGFVLVE